MSDAPLFIIGAGRSGSTLFFDLLSHHHGSSWASTILQKWPDRRRLNQAFLAAAHHPLTADWARRRASPSEAYAYWDRDYPGFSDPMRDLRADDASPRAAARLRRSFEAIPSPKRPHLAIKITGWPRVGFLNDIWPEGRFIHVVRDGRAFCNSLLNVPWWRGWQGPQNWRWGPLDADEQALWERHDRSFVALAGLQWNRLMAAAEASKEALPTSRWMDVRYEDLCADPRGTFAQTLAFADWPSSKRLERAIERRDVRSTDDKWRRDLSPRQQEILTDVTRPWLERLGYLDD
ncbi:MAG: sulfotransferase family protein [Thermoplasmatota archaeon]